MVRHTIQKLRRENMELKEHLTQLQQKMEHIYKLYSKLFL